MGPTLRGDALTPSLADAFTTVCDGSRATLDGRLGGVALAIAERARGNWHAPSLREVNARARAEGLIDPTPEVWLAAAGSAAEIEQAIRAQGDPGSAPSAKQRTHCGGAVVMDRNKWLAVLVWSKRILTLDDVPAHVAAGATVMLHGQLQPGYEEPVLAITGPGGDVERIALGKGPSFRRGVGLSERGEHRIEILAKGDGGVTVAANFPIAVGTAVDHGEASTDDAIPERSPEDVRAALMARIAEEREKQGLAPLRANPAVDAVAQAHSQDMLDHHFIAHTSKQSGEPPERVARAGLSSTVVLENIGRGYSAEEIHLGLMESPGHRANILNPDARELGVGVVAEPEGDRLAFIATEVFTRLVEPLTQDEALALLARSVAAGRRKAHLPELKLDAELGQVAQEAAKSLAKAPAARHEQLLAQATRQVRTPPAGLTKLGATLVISPDVEEIAQHPSLYAPALRFLGVGIAPQKTPHGQSFVVVLLLGES